MKQVMIITVLALFLFLYPHSSLAQNNEKTNLVEYIDSLGSTTKFDSKSFWEFREMYDVGSYRFDREGLETLSADLTQFELPLKNIQGLYVLHYESKRVKSLEFLTHIRTLEDTIDSLKLADAEIFVQNETMILLKKDKNYYLITLIPLKDELKVNGFFKTVYHKELLQKYRSVIILTKMN